MSQGTQLLHVPEDMRPKVSRTSRPAPAGPLLDVLLGDLAHRRAQVALAELELHEVACQAREQGASWAAIGEALGMTAKSAWKRYSR